MSIAFQCPSCRKPYTVKDDLAGKKVVCRACKKPVIVPRSSTLAAPSAEVESLAVSALVEEPAAAVAEAASSFEAECPNCMEVVTWEASKAGKQAPCPQCKRIVRVPMPADGKPKDWRAAPDKPAGAKVEVDADLDSAWGRHKISIVDRESLKEAGVIADRKRPPLTQEQKVKRGVLLACLGLVAFVGVWWWIGHRAVAKRQASIQEAISLLGNSKEAVPNSARAEVYRGAAEFRLRQADANAEEAMKYVKEAYGAASQPTGASEQGLESVALLTEVALTVADMPGTKAQIQNNQRLSWTDVQKTLRYTFEAMPKDQYEGVVLALQRLTRKLKLEGPNNRPAALGVINNMSLTPEEQADASAAVALELLGVGDDERKLAEELANSLRSVAAANPQARVVALFVALNQPQAVRELKDPLANGGVSQVSRLGFAEGYARIGDNEKARAIAQIPGAFADRFQAFVTVAEAATDAAQRQFVAEAVEMLEKELGTNDLPHWRLIRLAQLCARISDAGPGQRLHDVLINYSGTMSPRAQTIRALALWELLRGATATVTEAKVKEITPPTTLGHLLAWETLARRTTPANLDGWPDAVRPLGLIGMALGLQDR
jgi:hypothetical protein